MVVMLDHLLPLVAFSLTKATDTLSSIECYNRGHHEKMPYRYIIDKLGKTGFYLNYATSLAAVLSAYAIFSHYNLPLKKLDITVFLLSGFHIILSYSNLKSCSYHPNFKIKKKG